MYTSYSNVDSARKFMTKVFGWMSLALAVTASVAYYVFSNPGLFYQIFSHSWIVMSIFIIQIALVMALSGAITRISFTTAMLLYLTYALSVGLTFSSIFFAYHLHSIFSSFIICAGMFAIMGLYGYFSKADLTDIGSFARMGLFGLIIAMVVNIFLQNGMFDIVISLMGVALFTILTAYDTQRILRIGQQLSGAGELEDRFAISGALTLYLDFINLFLMILRLTGSRRN